MNLQDLGEKFQNASEFCLLKYKKDLLIDYLAILHLQFSKKDYQKIFSEIKYIIVVQDVVVALKVKNQRPRCKQRGIKLAALQSSGVFDPRGSRQMSASSHLARCSRE